MTDCDALIDHFRAQTRIQVHLAVLAETAPIAEMHFDLALASHGQARVAVELCDDD